MRAWRPAAPTATIPANAVWGSFHTLGLNFVLCDGSVRMIPKDIDMELFCRLATIAEKVPAQTSQLRILADAISFSIQTLRQIRHVAGHSCGSSRGMRTVGFQSRACFRPRNVQSKARGRSTCQFSTVGREFRLRQSGSRISGHYGRARPLPIEDDRIEPARRRRRPACRAADGQGNCAKAARTDAAPAKKKSPPAAIVGRQLEIRCSFRRYRSGEFRFEVLRIRLKTTSPDFVK